MNYKHCKTKIIQASIGKSSTGKQSKSITQEIQSKIATWDSAHHVLLQVPTSVCASRSTRNLRLLALHTFATRTLVIVIRVIRLAIRLKISFQHLGCELVQPVFLCLVAQRRSAAVRYVG